MAQLPSAKIESIWKSNVDTITHPMQPKLGMLWIQNILFNSIDADKFALPLSTYLLFFTQRNCIFKTIVQPDTLFQYMHSLFTKNRNYTSPFSLCLFTNGIMDVWIKTILHKMWVNINSFKKQMCARKTDIMRNLIV